GVQLFVAMFPQGFGSLWEVQLSPRAGVVAALAGLLAALAIAVAAHLSLRRLDLAGTAAVSGRSAAARPARRVAGALVAFNVALALAVTVASLLLLDSHRRLQVVDLGYRPQGLLSGSVLLPAAAYADDAALRSAYARIREALGAQPGVASVALSSSLPLGQNNNDTSVLVEGRPTAQPDGRAHVWLNRISPEFLPTLGIALREGRNFDGREESADALRVLANAAFVASYLPGDSVLGRRIGFGPPEQP